MQLKANGKPLLFTTIFRERISRILLKSKFKYLFYLIFLIAIVLYFINYGIELHRTTRNESIRRFILNLVDSNVRIPIQYFHGLMSSPEVLEISMKHLDYQKLAYNRFKAWERGFLLDEEKSGYVRATIVHKGKSYNAKVRLRGHWLDHLQSDKWSLRIKIKGDNAILGLKRFSIQNPGVRNFIHEWIYQKLLAYQGLIALKYKFVQVKLNGKDLGVFALEEHFDKILAERNQRREGLHFKPLINDVSIYGEDKILEEKPSLKNQIRSVRRAFKALLSGELKTHQVFDVKKTAKYFAISDLFGAHHGHLPANFVCYFNPITNLFEPIGYDGNVGLNLEELGGISGAFRSKWGLGLTLKLEYIFSDPIFYEEYVKQLQQLSPEYIKQFLDSIELDLKKNLEIIYKSYPEYHYDSGYLFRNLDYIHKALNASGKLKDITYSVTGDSTQLTVRFDNTPELPIEILGLYLQDKQIAQTEDRVILYPSQEKMKVRHEINFRPISNLSIPDSLTQEVVLRYKVLGSSQITESKIVPDIKDERYLPIEYIYSNNLDIKSFPFFSLDSTNNEILFNTGVHTISRDIIIPKGYRLKCLEGTTINLVQNAKIISYSPVTMIGSDDFPIVVTSSDSSGQGITVMKALSESVLKNVLVEKQTNPTVGSWNLTGAVNFYESPVAIIDCTFREIYSEDAVNIVRSEFEIANSSFFYTNSDALDVDFGHGTITNTSFLNCGNDAIDVSGSNVSIKNVIINDVGDKGLSAGENSQMEINSVYLKDVAIAIASKDLSDIKGENVNVSNSQIGFVLFQKKPEYGPGRAVISSVKMESVKIPYMVEENSILFVDNVRIKPNRTDVKKILYGVEFGKASH